MMADINPSVVTGESSMMADINPSVVTGESSMMADINKSVMIHHLNYILQSRINNNSSNNDLVNIT